jgi:hypothetical protein
MRTVMVINPGSAVLDSLLYISTAQVLFTPTRLEELVSASRIQNARLGITGQLLFRDGAFMQWLEGPADAVEKLWRKIRTDERHYAVVTLSEGSIRERHFPESPMGFRNLRDPAVRQLPGFDEFRDTPLSTTEFSSEPARAVRLLALLK